MDKPNLSRAGKYILSWVEYTKGTSKSKHTGRDQELEAIVLSILGDIRLNGVCSSRPLVGGGLVGFIQPDPQAKKEKGSNHRSVCLLEAGCRGATCTENMKIS